MKERIFTAGYWLGTPGASVVIHVEFPFPWVLLGIKATQSNAGAADLTAAGGVTIAATALGKSNDPAYIQPSVPTAVAADTVVTLTIDHNGAVNGTAGQGINFIVIGLVGEG